MEPLWLQVRGFFKNIYHETMGVSLGMGEDMTPENIQKANWDLCKKFQIWKMHELYRMEFRLQTLMEI